MKPHTSWDYQTCGASNTLFFIEIYCHDIKQDTHLNNGQYHATHHLCWTTKGMRSTMWKPSPTRRGLGKLRGEWNIWWNGWTTARKRIPGNQASTSTTQKYTNLSMHSIGHTWVHSIQGEGPANEDIGLRDEGDIMGYMHSSFSFHFSFSFHLPILHSPRHRPTIYISISWNTYIVSHGNHLFSSLNILFCWWIGEPLCCIPCYSYPLIYHLFHWWIVDCVPIEFSPQVPQLSLHSPLIPSHNRLAVVPNVRHSSWHHFCCDQPITI